MNRARAAKAARGTLGKAKSMREISRAEITARDAGRDTVMDMVAAIYSDFRAWSHNERASVRGDYVPETDFPF
jgi:hypothetical protein